MPVETAILDILAHENTPAADRALLAALRAADFPAAQVIVEALLVRNQRVGLYGLIEAFHAFDDAIQQHILGKMDELFSVLREASQSRSEQVRLNVLEAIRRGCAYRAAYLADAALHDRSAQVREAASETLYALADQLLRTSPVADLELDHLDPEELQSRMAGLEWYAEDRRQVVSAIESGLQSFAVHLHPRVVEAAMWFADDLGGRFWSMLLVPGSRAAHVAVSVIAGSRNPRLVPFCIGALSYGEFRPHVVKALATCTAPAFLDEWLRECWRLVQPKTARSMAALKELACVQHGAAELLHLPPDGQRHLARWVNAIGIPTGEKLGLFKEMLRRGDESARRPAALVLVDRPDEGATTLLRRLARDNQPEVSWIARYELARRRPLEYPPCELGSGLDGSAEAPDAREERRPAATFERYWAAFDQLSEEERRYFGGQVLGRDASARTTLARRLVAPEPADRVRALRIVTLLGIAGEFVDQLYQLSYDGEPEVRGTAVKALGQLPDATSRRVLRNALSDEDSRVEANAVEEIGASGAKSAVADLLPKLGSSDNRVRANAVKALLRLGVRQAAEALLLMLNDENRAQRISALWLIDHMGLLTLTTRVARMAGSDEDVQVRDRAKSLSDRLVRPEPETGTLPQAQPEVVPSSP